MAWPARYGKIKPILGVGRQDVFGHAPDGVALGRGIGLSYAGCVRICAVSIQTLAPRDTIMPETSAKGAILARRLFLGGGAAPLPDHVVEFDGGRITAIRPTNAVDARTPDIEQADIVAPGFIDLQINGAGDRQFNHDPSLETLCIMAAAARKGGTAHILPTFITAPGQDYHRAITATQAAIACGTPGILGLHLEGPFLSPERPGIHRTDAIRPITKDDIDQIGVAARSMPILLTVAPEVLPPGALSALVAAGVRVFAGHSNASADAIDAAEQNGLAGATHLFNAMTQMTARAPGVVGAVMASNRLFAGIIADGHHVDWHSLRVACRAMQGRLFLVTDAMLTLAGTRDDFMLDDRRITLRNGRLQDSRGTLAGAHVDMAQSVRNVVDHCGVPLADALHMASGIPAAALGYDAGLGAIAVGAPVSLTLLTETLTVQGVRV